jgi:ketosteroid isomerase-like protein
MRNASLFLLCLTMALPYVSQAQTSHRRPSPKTSGDTSSAAEDRAAIQELDDKEIKANLALDVKALELLWDPEIVSMPPGHAAISGLEANRAYLEQEAKAMENFQILGYEQSWQEVRIAGDYAYEFGTVQTHIGPMNPGPEVDTTYNVMRVLKKQADGAWKIYRAIWNSASEPKPPEKPTETPRKTPSAEEQPQ